MTLTLLRLTGDHQFTATAIARAIEIIGPDSPASAVMPAAELNALSDEQIDALPELPLVIARCDPDVGAHFDCPIQNVLPLSRRRFV